MHFQPTKIKAEPKLETSTIDVEPEQIQHTIDQILPADKLRTNYQTGNVCDDDDDLTMADLREANLIPDDGNAFILDDSTMQELMDEQQPNATVKVNSNDILNMEIIFDNVGYDAGPNEADPINDAGLKEEHMDDSSQLLVPMPENTAFNSSYCDTGDTNEDVNDDDEENESDDEESDGDDDDTDSDNDMDKLNDLQGSLVVVASQDSKDPTKIVHEVFVMSPTTGQLSEEPLDLPADVIQQIMLTMNPA